MIQAHKQIEPLLHCVRIREFDQESRTQFTRGREKGIVHIQLLLDLLRVEDPLDANHFLDLETQSFPILEDQRDLLAKTAPPDANCACNDCPFMKKNTLEAVHRALVTLGPEITIPEDLRLKALRPIERMLELSV